MGADILTFGDTKIEKKNILSQNFLKEVDVEKVLVSNKISFGEKKL